MVNPLETVDVHDIFDPHFTINNEETYLITLWIVIYVTGSNISPHTDVLLAVARGF